MSNFDYGKTKPDGQYERYPSAKLPTYKQPLRDSYKHTACGKVTTMRGEDLVQTYATNPYFYSHTFCCYCQRHFPLSEFVWLPDEAPMDKVSGEPGLDLRVPVEPEYPSRANPFGNPNLMELVEPAASVSRALEVAAEQLARIAAWLKSAGATK